MIPPALPPVPHAAPPPLAPPEEGSEPTRDPAEFIAAPGRLLVVEDDYFVGLTIENALEDEGHKVLAVVPTGEEALRIAATDRPDLALLDIRLAGPLDGIDTAIALRRIGIPAMFASAHSDEGMRSRAAAAAPLGWLTKPFSPAELTAAVAAALRRLRGN